MVNVNKTQEGNAWVVRLSGSIEENVNFEQLIGVPPEPPGELVVNCKEVPRINSVGVKSWIKYFQSVQSKGTKLTFVECSTAIVEQVNMISNFSCGGTIESMFVPFSCNQCRSELVGLFKSEDLKKIKMQLPDLKCTKCGGTAVFDDIPEEYFAFLMR